jgi:hypothetical protein
LDILVELLRNDDAYSLEMKKEIAQKIVGNYYSPKKLIS